MRDEVHLERVCNLVISAFYEVCTRLRPGFLETVYVGAMCVELRKRGVEFKREWPVAVRYRDVEVGHYRADLLVAGRLIVEVKAGRRLDDSARWQALNYLNATGLSLGLVLYFGYPPSVQRVVASAAYRQRLESDRSTDDRR